MIVNNYHGEDTASLAWWTGEASASKADEPRVVPRFSWSSRTTDLETGTLVTALPDERALYK